MVSERGFAFRGHKECFERRSISLDMAVQSVLSLSGITPAHRAVASKPHGNFQVRRQSSERFSQLCYLTTQACSAAGLTVHGSSLAKGTIACHVKFSRERRSGKSVPNLGPEQSCLAGRHLPPTGHEPLNDYCLVRGCLAQIITSNGGLKPAGASLVPRRHICWLSWT